MNTFRNVLLACTLGTIALASPRIAHADCQNGVLEGLEECDPPDGPFSNTLPDTCREDCMLPGCGDGVTDSGEQCDDGPSNSNLLPDACRQNCLNPSCGDGIIDVLSGEMCDLGPANGTQGALCSSQCIVPYCGNGVIDTGEQCDAGPANSNLLPDACRENCMNATCGDDVQDSGEECDLGLQNDDYEPGGCRTTCQYGVCGDGVVDADFGEECDLGAGNADDGSSVCHTNCTHSGCGDHVRAGSEICDDGNSSEADACTNQCRPNVCGDDRVHAGVENCDEIGVCDYSCRVPTSTCGDGVLDAGEECDGGSANANAPDAACRLDCRVRRCGDGIVDSGESCDRGPLCAPDCTRLRDI